MTPQASPHTFSNLDLCLGHIVAGPVEEVVEVQADNSTAQEHVLCARVPPYEQQLVLGVQLE